MIPGIIIILALVYMGIWMIIAQYIHNNMYRFKPFNHNRKCYFKIHIDELKRMNEELINEGYGDKNYIEFEGNYVTLHNRKVKIRKDGYFIFLNEKGYLLMRAIRIPILLTLIGLPLLLLLYYCRSILLFGYIFGMIFLEYDSLLIYIKYKRNYDKMQLLDEKHPYKHNYITYLLFITKGLILEISMMVTSVLLTHNILAIIILLFDVTRYHYYIFADVFDKLLNRNSLDNNKVKKFMNRELKIGFFHLGLLEAFMGIAQFMGF